MLSSHSATTSPWYDDTQRACVWVCISRSLSISTSVTSTSLLSQLGFMTPLSHESLSHPSCSHTLRHRDSVHVSYALSCNPMTTLLVDAYTHTLASHSPHREASMPHVERYGGHTSPSLCVHTGPRCDASSRSPSAAQSSSRSSWVEVIAVTCELYIRSITASLYTLSHSTTFTCRGAAITSLHHAEHE